VKIKSSFFILDKESDKNKISNEEIIARQISNELEKFAAQEQFGGELSALARCDNTLAKQGTTLTPKQADSERWRNTFKPINRPTQRPISESPPR
jgi:hypothetical protein